MKKLTKKSLQTIVNKVQCNGGLDNMLDNVGVPKEVKDTELETQFVLYAKLRKELTQHLDWLCDNFGVDVG